LHLINFNGVEKLSYLLDHINDFYYTVLIVSLISFEITFVSLFRGNHVKARIFINGKTLLLVFNTTTT